MKYTPRVLKNKLEHALKHFPVVGITGPRQSGKSTLLRHVLSDYAYVNFDDPRMIELFEADPESFMKHYHDRVIFDEVQYVPSIFRYIKIAVDNDRQNSGKFVLTGSSQFAFLQKTTESLAGRIALLSLLPFQLSEMDPTLYNDAIFKGSYPELVLKQYAQNDMWYASYLDTYLNKDVRALSQIGDIRDLQRFIRLLAINTAQPLDQTRYANEIGVSVSTIKRWTSLLEASYIIFLLPPFYNNLGKRIIKRPKVYFWDVGLVSFLTGIDDSTQYNKSPLCGALFENHVIAEIHKKQKHEGTQAELFYYRTSNGGEIDLIVDYRSHQEYFEIKKTASFSAKLLQGLKRLAPDSAQCYLLYSGDNFPVVQNVHVMNYQHYLLKPNKAESA